MAGREVTEGSLEQGVDEQIVYKITTTPWVSSPTAVVVRVFDVTANYIDVTSAVMPSGSPSVSGDVITLPKLRSLTTGRIYRVEIQFDGGGNTWEPYFIVACAR